MSDEKPSIAVFFDPCVSENLAPLLNDYLMRMVPLGMLNGVV